MTKPYSEDDLIDQLTRDLTWRIREISDLKTATRDADAVSRSVLLRALIAICYAHWEGHVKFSAQKYMQHISLRRLRFSQLDDQFMKNYFVPRLKAIAKSGNQAEMHNLIDDILDGKNRTYKRIHKELIDTGHNLNTDIMRELCIVCGVDYSTYVDKSNFIDVLLLKRRNAIAHGEDTFINISELDEITDLTTGIMRDFSNKILNKVVTRSYFKT